MNINLENFTVIEDFGQNDIYESVLAINEADNFKLFIKKTSKSILQNDIKRKYFENELAVNKTFDHENIVIFLDKKDILNDTYLLFEAVNGGNLSEYFKKYQEKNNKPFPEEIVQNIIKQIATALKYLHDRHIIYRNLGLEHAFLNFENEDNIPNFNFNDVKIKLGNFHLCKVLEENELAHSFIGIPIYMDPNILFKSKEPDKISYEYKVDIWSLGTICYELLVGTTPFDGNNYDDLIVNVKTGKYTIPKSLNLSTEAISFIDGMLQYDPNKRFDINQVLAHDFLNKDIKSFSHDGIDKLGEVNDKEIILNININ